MRRETGNPCFDCRCGWYDSDLGCGINVRLGRNNEGGKEPWMTTIIAMNAEDTVMTTIWMRTESG